MEGAERGRWVGGRGARGGTYLSRSSDPPTRENLKGPTLRRKSFGNERSSKEEGVRRRRTVRKPVRRGRNRGWVQRGSPCMTGPLPEMRGPSAQGKL